MKFPRLFRRETKANPVGAAYVMGGGAAWVRPSNRTAFIEEGYRQNVVIYRCVKEIANAMTDLVLEVHDDNGPIDGHPALALMARPNPAMSWDGFIEQIITDRLILGEIAVVAPPGPRPVELWPVSPLNVEVKPGSGGLPVAYVHNLNGVKTTFQVDQLTGLSDMWFDKAYDPANHWRGMSPLVAAGLVADTHNAGLKWNYQLLKNSARPSGIVRVAAGAGEAVAGVIEYFRRRVQGPENAGTPLVAEGEIEWTPMDQTPRDMDFMNTQKEAAKLIASAFGVPLPLIDNDASTFNNMEQAKERFYTDTVLPLARAILSSLGVWLLPRYGEGLRFEIDMDQIAALESVRSRKFDRMMKAKQAGVLTVDEVRLAIGYEELGGAAAVLDPLAGIAFPDEGGGKALGYRDL